MKWEIGIDIYILLCIKGFLRSSVSNASACNERDLGSIPGVPAGAGPRCVRISLRQHCRDHQCLPIGFHVFQAGGGRGARGRGRGGTGSQAGLSAPGLRAAVRWVLCAV